MCGTAHTLYVKFRTATRVLSEGGDLKIQFDDAGQRIKLAGKVQTVSQRESYVKQSTTLLTCL